jgi:hypothetical protein
VLAKSEGGSTCSVSENAGFWTGAAGMVGYSITSNGKTIYLRLAATDPYWSARNNRTMAAIYDWNKGIGQDEYNDIYSWGDSAETGFDGKTLKVRLFGSCIVRDLLADAFSRSREILEAQLLALLSSRSRGCSVCSDFG